MKHILPALTWLAWVASAPAALLINFPFNEGSGTGTVDTASGLVGVLGAPLNPAVDTVALIDASPSGAAGDRCITNSGAGFLLADDSSQRVLDITNGPITIECWIYIDHNTPAKGAEGIAGYGSSYKMGMKGGYQVFTLFGQIDITNYVGGLVPVDNWVHLAAGWEPGVGVHFYINGAHEFVTNTLPAARPLQNTYLGIGSEGLANNTVAALDRLRIHHALLTETEIDKDAASPKPLTADTLVAYDFNEASFPCLNAKAPSLPAVYAGYIVEKLYAPVWTNDTPAGLPGDYALAFLTENPLTKEYVNVNYGSTTIDLGANNTNYTLQAWVKLPTGPLEERRVIYRTAGAAPRISFSINATRGLHTTVLGKYDYASSVLVPNDGRWHHVAAVMENFARVRFYLDGIARQTINTPSANTATASGTGNLLIGKESETRFFRGVLDRVILHNEALTNSTLDFPAIPGMATFPTLASHPTAVITNLGASVSFTATPSSASAASYQWRYRTNLADLQSIPIPGATSTILTLSNITTADLGYYFLAVTNAVGASESYGARLSLTITASDLANKPFGFEPPTYVSGMVEGQDFWTNDQNQNANAARVLTASEIAAALTSAGLTPGTTVHGGSQALLVSGVGVATTSIRQISGLENDKQVTVDVWARPLMAGYTGLATNNVFFTIENSAGTRAAAFRIGPSQSIDYGSTNSGVWVATGQQWNENTWYQFTFRLDYTARTYDFQINGTKVNTSPIPFYVGTSDSFRQIRIYRGANQAGMILDDLIVTGAPKLTTIGAAGSTVTINWAGGQPPYQLQRRSSLDTGTWENVGATTSSTQATDTVDPNGMFYRVLGN